MRMSRRKFIGAAAALPGAVAVGSLSPAFPGAGALANTDTANSKGKTNAGAIRTFGSLEFAEPQSTHLNAGSSYPMSLGAMGAVQDYLQSRAGFAQQEDYRLPSTGPIEKFARLMNVDTDELTYVQSTTTGEQMVLRALDIPHSGGHIITDSLHFFGSLPMYRELEKQGMDVTFIREENGRINPQAIKDAIRDDTKLIALSLVSTVNGFTHDLKTICDFAHQKGVYVFADIIHAAGCIPLDLHETGVDFASTASYKWLMGDFGLGFIYAARSTHEHLRQANYGYYGMNRFTSHIYPYDEPGEHVVDYAFSDNANGLFALGTRQHTVIAHLDYALGQINEIGVQRIHRHSQTHVRHLKKELALMGFELHTPDDSPAPMVTCIYKDARQKLAPVFREQGLNLTVSRNSFRASVSVLNNDSDIEHLLQVLRDKVV